MQIMLSFLVLASAFIFIIFLFSYKDGIQTFGKKQYAIIMLFIGFCFEISIAMDFYYSDIAFENFEITFEPKEVLISTKRNENTLTKTYKETCNVAIKRVIKFSPDETIDKKEYEKPCSEAKEDPIILEWVKVILNDQTDKATFK